MVQKYVDTLVSKTDDQVKEKDLNKEH